MAETASIAISEEIKRLADTRAAAAGYASVGDYVGALILADAGEPISPELESHLLVALNTPARKVTAEFWDRKRSRLGGEHPEDRQ
jgi:hypothetical protein